METIIGSVANSVSAASFKARTQNNITWYVCEPLALAGFRHGFSTRLGGVSPLPKDSLNLGRFSGDTLENVAENRRRFLQALEAQHYGIISGHQVHSAVLRVVLNPGEANQPGPNCDGTLSNLSGLLAAVVSADCTPVLIGDPVTRSYAAIHAGWRGTAARIVEKAVATMAEQFGAQPRDCIAAIGPAAGPCCYEVGADVIDQFRSSFDYADELFSRPHGQKVNLDVPSANARQLRDAGVLPGNIYQSGLCTMCRPDLFFSYRTEHSRGPVGRLLAVIGL